MDGRSDIYSLGVLGWEMLTGRRPWAGESLYGIIYKQKHEDLPRITALRPRVPANLLFAIEGALKKDRTQRWQTIDGFLEQLTYNPPPVLAEPYPPGEGPVDDEPTVQFRAATLLDERPIELIGPWGSVHIEIPSDPVAPTRVQEEADVEPASLSTSAASNEPTTNTVSKNTQIRFGVAGHAFLPWCMPPSCPRSS